MRNPKLFIGQSVPNLKKYFQKKIVTISPLDKPWMNLFLKKINRQMKQEYWKNRRSSKYLSLKKTFSSLKKI